MAITEVHVKGYKEVLQNKQVDMGGQKLAILLPGRGYNNDMPLQFYSAKLLGELGYDILMVNYNYLHQDFAQSPKEEQIQWISTDVTVSVEKVMKEKSYQEFAVVCKSIGTIAGLELLKSKLIEDARVIWLTPLLHSQQITSEMKRITNPSLVIIGTKDPCYIKENVAELHQIENVEVVSIPDANHSLELEGDIQSSIQVMSDILQAITKFMKG
ncbi:MAG: hypothetical protein H0Z32_11855 [Bacillaceae bacterium]|nr:hypothetical protein [Bacillaceae bacterium]